jgi:hypothetical protein
MRSECGIIAAVVDIKLDRRLPTTSSLPPMASNAFGGLKNPANRQVPVMPLRMHACSAITSEMVSGAERMKGNK